MRREEVDALVESIWEVGRDVYRRREQRMPRPTITFHGRPQLRILSLDPFHYERLRRRASPILQGEFEVVTVIPFVANDTGTVYAKLAFESGSAVYAHPAGAEVLNSIARAIGIETNFVPD